MSTAPTVQATSRSSITVSWVLTSNGGSPILGFKLYRYNKAAGSSSVVYDGSRSSVVTWYIDQGLQPGVTYGYKVVAINRVGTSSKSPEVTVAPGEAPGKPPSPSLLASSATSITLAFKPVAETGGLPIVRYHLYRDQGSLTSSFTEIASYGGSDMTFVVTQANEASMATGTAYRFRFTAENTLAEGPPSDIVSFALGALPSKPSAPTLDRDRSTETSLYVEWSALTSQDAEVEGYRLYMSQLTEGSDFKIVFDGFDRPATFAYNVTGLITGASYSFYVVAKSHNGVGEASDISTWLV